MSNVFENVSKMKDCACTNKHVLSAAKDDNDDDASSVYSYVYSDEDEENDDGEDTDASERLLIHKTDSVATASTQSTSSSSNSSMTAFDETSGGAAVKATKIQRNKWEGPYNNNNNETRDVTQRIEQAKTGSKRALAKDLERIMKSDTAEAGFTLEPASEDSMDEWNLRLFNFDPDSDLAKDMEVLGLDCIELEMSFPNDYPFAPPFVRVMRPRFQKQTGFVIDGALCMELLTKDGWNPISDIEAVIVSVHTHLVMGGGRLEAAVALSNADYKKRLQAARKQSKHSCRQSKAATKNAERVMLADSYSDSAAKRAHEYLADYHQKKGWSDWLVRKG